MEVLLPFRESPQTSVSNERDGRELGRESEEKIDGLSK